MTGARITQSGPIHPREPQRPTGLQSRRSAGFWAAVLTSVFSVCWLVSVVIAAAVAPVGGWRGVDDYAGDFSEWHLLPLYPSLLLPLAFLVLLAAIHLRASGERKIWSLSAIAVGVLYATMASVNYNIQVVSVRRNLTAAETDGLDMFPLAYPDSITRALGNSYVYMAVAMVFAGLAFGGATRRERAIKRFLVLAGLAAPLQFTWSMFDTSHLLEASLIPWILGAVVAPLLIAGEFRRQDPVTGLGSDSPAQGTTP